MEKTNLEVLPVSTEPISTTTRTLTITVKVQDTSDIDAIVSQLKESGEVTGVSYYEQTYNTANINDPNYLY